LIAVNEARIRTSAFALPVAVGIAAASLALCAAFYLPIFGGLKQAFHVNIDGHYAEIWLYSVLDLMAAALLIAVLTEFKPVSLLCRLAFVRHIGRISFGIYVLTCRLSACSEKKCGPCCISCSRSEAGPCSTAPSPVRFSSVG
jgi:hypothetical protein